MAALFVVAEHQAVGDHRGREVQLFVVTDEHVLEAAILAFDIEVQETEDVIGGQIAPGDLVDVHVFVQIFEPLREHHAGLDAVDLGVFLHGETVARVLVAAEAEVREIRAAEGAGFIDEEFDLKAPLMELFQEAEVPPRLPRRVHKVDAGAPLPGAELRDAPVEAVAARVDLHVGAFPVDMLRHEELGADDAVDVVEVDLLEDGVEELVHLLRRQAGVVGVDGNVAPQPGALRLVQEPFALFVVVLGEFLCLGDEIVLDGRKSDIDVVYIVPVPFEPIQILFCVRSVERKGELPLQCFTHLSFLPADKIFVALLYYTIQD